MTEYIADYIVVGMGAAGALVSNRLSRHFSVIGLEAGANTSKSVPIKKSIYVGIEYGLEEAYNPTFFWQQTPTQNGSLETRRKLETERVACIKYNNALTLVQPTTVGIYTTGRLLGGGSSINGLQYVRPSLATMQEWFKIGGKPWCPNRITSIFNKLECLFVATLESEHQKANLVDNVGFCKLKNSHSGAGAMHIRQAPANPPTLTVNFTQSVVDALSYPLIPNDNYNNVSTPIGPFNRWQLFQKPNTDRANSVVNFFEPIGLRRAKGSKGLKMKSHHRSYTLTVLLQTTATRIEFNNNKHAKKIYALQNGKPITIFARKGIVLCCGVFSSELLMRSGIGCPSLLKCLNIPVIKANHNVGQAFLNHVFITAAFNVPATALGLPPNDPQALYSGGAFLPPLLTTDNQNKRGYQLIGGFITPGVFTISILYLQPHSLGQVKIQSKDPLTVSVADNNYFNVGSDTQAFVLAVRQYLVPIANSLFTNYGYTMVNPSVEVIDNDVALINWIYENFNHTHHWTGSNKFGCSESDAGSVTDSVGRVQGVHGLRVADTSILPTIPDGNTCASAYLVASIVSKSILKHKK
jgi:choline dehydrogenase